MTDLTVPQIDFSSLGELPQIYKQANRERTLADLGKGLANGTVDYKQAGATLASLGDISGGLSLMKMGEEEKAGREFSATVGGIYGQPRPQPQSTSAPASNGPMGALPGLEGAIDASAAKYGIDPAYLRKTAMIESGGGRNLSNPSSSAKGPFQFIDSTAKQYGLDNPNDPLQSADAAARLTADNKAALTSALGREPTPGELYLAHQQGAAGAVKLITNPNAPAVSLVGQSAIINNGGSPAMTAAQFAQGFTRKFDNDGASLPQNAQLAGPASSDGSGQPGQSGQGVPVQQLPAALMQDPSTQNIGKLLAASVNPRLPAAQKEVAKTLLAHALKASELTSDQKEYLGAVAQGETATYTDWVRGNKKAGATAITIDQKGETKFEEEFGKKQADRWVKYLDNADAARKKMVDVSTMREISQRLGSQGAAAGVKEAIGPYAETLGINLDGLSDIQAYTQVIQRLAPQQRAPGSGSTSDIEFKGFVKSLPGLSQNPAAREIGLNTMEALARDDMARGEIASRLATGEIKRAQAEKELRGLPDPMKGFVEWRKSNPDVYGQALKGSAAPAVPKVSAPQPAAPPMDGARKAPDGNWYLQRDGKTYRIDQ